ncbi:alpha/beta hydrolase [Ornithinimicrobium flavum]|uniref:alpha/beta hydrolase n=1 Tax=Ornithinimicrobium flavum TaxID=1288636 RepID=UPI00106F9EE3|nr:alpha/beta hydrolase [Ornithinimicrobium flavum]
MTWRGPRLKDLLAQIDALEADKPTMEIPTDSGVGTQVVTDFAAYHRQREALERPASEHRDELAARDRACRDALARVDDDLEALVPPGTSPQFLRSLVPGGAWGAFQESGVVDTSAEAALAARITEHLTATQLRHLLAGIPVDRLESFLARHPLAMGILADSYLPRDGSDATLTRLWEIVGPVSDSGQVGDPAVIADIRAFWQGLDADEQLRMRLLYPGLVGRLDGIPVAHRAAANRLLVASALEQERIHLAWLETLPDNATQLEQLRATLPGDPFSRWVAGKVMDGLASPPSQGLLHDFRLRDGELARSRSRIAFYTDLLAARPGLRAQDVTDASGMLLPSDQRAILLFDPRGDGLYAEWHGDLEAANVGIFVPGTTTDMAGIEVYARRMAGIPAAVETTAMVTWMGIDLPNAVVADATQTRYSSDGGAALLRFVEGLDLRDRTVTAVGHSAGGGIVGYADVLGMVVDRTFLVAPSGSGLGINTPLPFPFGEWGAEPDTPSRYPAVAWDGETVRSTTRFTMTAPGDAILVAQASEDVRFWVGGVPDDWGHGLDPNDHEQFVRLETGRWTGGDRLEGMESHSWVVTPGNDAWNNIVGVVSGGQVIPYREERRWWGSWHNVYDDPDYQGTDPVPIDALSPEAP